MLHNNTSMSAARPSDLKLNNRMQILELFKAGGVYSVAELARKIGVSRQTVMKGIQFFLEKGIVVSDGKADSTSMGGKRAELFSLSADRYLLSLLVCPEDATLNLINFRCETVESRSIGNVCGLEPEALVVAVCAEYIRMLGDHGIDINNVYGFCATLPGIVDSNGVMCCTSFFPSWEKNVPIGQLFVSRLGGDMKVIVEGWGKVCGSASRSYDQSEQERVATVLTQWDTISACLIDQRRIVNGKDDMLSAFGHMILAPQDDEVCRCGSRGCFERQISAARLRMLAEAEGAEEGGMLSKDFTVKEMFKASAKGDAMAQKLSEYAAGQFARALRNLILIFAPDRVILLGDYACADERFMETLNHELRVFQRCGLEDRLPFRIEADQRSIKSLAITGAYTLLLDALFSDATTYA